MFRIGLSCYAYSILRKRQNVSVSVSSKCISPYSPGHLISFANIPVCIPRSSALIVGLLAHNHIKTDRQSALFKTKSTVRTLPSINWCVVA
jgi:hypothetical protein